MWRLLSRAAWPAAVSTGLLAWVLLALGGVGQVLLASSVAPSWPLLGALLLGALGATSTLALGVGTLAGAAGAMGRLREQGGLVALGALGVSPRALASRLAVLALPAAVLSLALAHVVEPFSRAALRDTRTLAAASVRPREGETVRLAGWWVAAGEGRLWFTDGHRRGSAGGWSLAPRQGGVLVSLADVAMEVEGTRLYADAVSIPVGLRGGKVHASERTTHDLRRQIAVSATLGRDGYERWQLHKRTALAVVLLPLSLAAAGFARRRSPGLVVGGTLFCTWVGVRVLDGTLGATHPGLATIALTGPAVAAAWFAWRR